MIRKQQLADAFILDVDKALRVLAGNIGSARQSPAFNLKEDKLDSDQKRHSSGLMRVNHVGEVCAQALYQSQARFTTNSGVATELKKSAVEESDHLAWTAERLRELGSRPSLLNPVWYGGAYLMGLIAARAGDRLSLGFVAETEKQVESHLASHLEELPIGDKKSRAIVEQMRSDEAAHGNKAVALGAAELPGLVKLAMRATAKVMTVSAYYL